MRRRAARWLLRGLLGVTAVLVVVVATVVLLARSDWGREQARARLLEALDQAVEGSVEIGSVEGNLLSEVTFRDVAIEGPAGEPVLRVDEVRADLSFRAAVGRRIEITTLELVRPVLVLEQGPEGGWNVARLAAADTVGAAPADTTRGFGSWISVSEAFIHDGRVEIRQPWPLEGGFLADSSRAQVDSAGERPVLVRDVRGIEARVRDLVLADPDVGMSGRLASLEATARPLEGPPLEIRDLEGRFALEDDRLYLADVELWLPSSRLSGEAVIALDARGIEGRVVAELAGDDLLWVDPTLPEDASVRGEIVAQSRQGQILLTATNLDVRFDGARMRGRGEVAFGDSVVAGPADLRFEGLDTRLAGRLGVEVPVDGTAEGRISLGSGVDVDGGPVEADVRFRRRADGAWSHVTVDGRLALGSDPAARGLAVRLSPLDLSLARDVNATFEAEGALEGIVRVDGPLRGMLAVDVDVTHRSAAAGVSNLRAEGGMRVADGLAFSELVVRADPLRVPVVEAFTAPLPIGGSLRGRVTLDGSTAGSLAADADVRHVDTTGVTHLVGTVRTAGSGAGRSVRVELNVPELPLATAGRFAPAAGLRGAATARLRAEGPLERLAVEAVLEPEGGGVMAVAGEVDAADPGRRYDLEAGFRAFDLSAASARAPATSLWGTAAAAGSGTEPGTLDAAVRVALADSLADPPPGGVPVRDGTRGMVRIAGRAAGGLATVDEAEVRLASATLTAEGTLGLVPEREGEVSWTLEVDSLADFVAWLPRDTAGPGAVPPRPALQAERMARVREDSLRRTEARAVERVAAGLPAQPEPEVDTLPHLPRDSVAGRVSLDGTAAGNLQRMDVRAEGELESLVALGHGAARGRVAFAADDLRPTAGDSVAGVLGDASALPPASILRLDLELDTAQVAGFGFAALALGIEHAGSLEDGEGTLQLAAEPDADRDILLHAGYDLALDRRSLRLDSMALRFDTVRWASTGPGSVSWGPDFAVEDLELVSRTGRIRADGRLPAEGGGAAGDALAVEIENLPMPHVVALLQDTLRVDGVLDLRARIEGSRSEPRARAELALVDGSVDGTELPDVDAEIAWADRVLTTETWLLGERRGLVRRDTLAVLRGTAAWALPGDTLAGPRTLDLVLLADSLPLESLPEFTPAVADLRGLVRGEVTVGGTLDDPDLEGALGVQFGRLDLTGPGVRLRDVEGTLRMEGRTLFADSLTATSGGGSLLARGTLDLDGEDGPVTSLTVVARDAIVADFDLAEGVRADADLQVTGPITALVVSGTARIREGIFYAPLEEPQGLDLEGAQAAQAISAAEVAEEALPSATILSRLRADVQVRVDRNTWVRALDGTAEVYTPDDGAPLSVRYDAAAGLPALDGVAHADRGEWTFAGRRFELTRGTATFLRTSELDPELQLTAVHEVARPGRDPIEIQITVGGRLQAPEITLTSDAQPPLPQTDLLSYLVFGTTSGSLMQLGGSGLSGGGGPGELGTLAGQQLTSIAIGSMVEQAFANVEARSGRYGLDVFRITAAQLPEELAFNNYFGNVLRGTQVEAGKYVTPRLFVAARGRPTPEAWPGLAAEYRTPAGFRWTAAWEPRYLPLLPAFGNDQTAGQTRALSTFLFWNLRY